MSYKVEITEQAQIPSDGGAATHPRKLYEQTVEDLDLSAVIAAVNGRRQRKVTPAVSGPESPQMAIRKKGGISA